MLLAFCVVVPSCEVGPGGADGVDSRQFQDVVVPAGFRLRDRAHESFSREDAGWRQGHFVYLGTVTINDAATYVLRRMPQHSWQMVSEEQVDEDGIRLRFERGIYSADYLFSRKDGTTQMIVDYATDYSKR